MKKKRKRKGGEKDVETKKHTTPGIRWSSPTQLLVWRLLAYLWESGRDPELSSTYGRMYFLSEIIFVFFCRSDRKGGDGVATSSDGGGYAQPPTKNQMKGVQV
jgi:hypothetical protein